MKNFVIGQIQGPWENFLPPLHGGKFRSYIENEQVLDEFQERAEELSEPESLRTPARSASPASVFDDDRSFLRDPSVLRRRQGSPIASSSSSMTSVSMYDETGLDELTRKGIEADLDKYPAIDSETQARIVKEYRKLGERIRAAGLFDCNYFRYFKEIVRYLIFLSISMYCLRLGWYKTSALFLGLFWHQITFTAHDAGHMGITHDFHLDTCIGIFIADFCGGLSLGWWKRSHNVSLSFLAITLILVAQFAKHGITSDRCITLLQMIPNMIQILSTCHSLPSATVSSTACSLRTMIVLCTSMLPLRSWYDSRTTFTTQSCALEDSICIVCLGSISWSGWGLKRELQLGIGGLRFLAW